MGDLLTCDVFHTAKKVYFSSLIQNIDRHGHRVPKIAVKCQFDISGLLNVILNTKVNPFNRIFKKYLTDV